VNFADQRSGRRCCLRDSVERCNQCITRDIDSAFMLWLGNVLTRNLHI